MAIEPYVHCGGRNVVMIFKFLCWIPWLTEFLRCHSTLFDDLLISAIYTEDTFALGAKVIRSDFSVDDLLTGADNFEDLSKIWDQAKEILTSALFNLTNWCANYPNFETDTSNKLLTTVFSSVKVIGIHWAPINDLFEFRLEYSFQQLNATKRNVLSVSSRLFDPLGLLSPIVIVA